MAEVVQIQGMRELAYALRQLPTIIAKKKLARPVYDASIMIRNLARAKAPVDTGRLRRSIIVKKLPGPAERAVYIVAVKHGKKYQHVGKKDTNQDAWYWTFIEFGTRFKAKREFLRPSFEELKRTALDHIVADIRLGIEDAALEVKWTIGGAGNAGSGGSHGAV